MKVMAWLLAIVAYPFVRLRSLVPRRLTGHPVIIHRGASAYRIAWGGKTWVSSLPSPQWYCEQTLSAAPKNVCDRLNVAMIAMATADAVDASASVVHAPHDDAPRTEPEKSAPTESPNFTVISSEDHGRKIHVKWLGGRYFQSSGYDWYKVTSGGLVKAGYELSEGLRTQMKLWTASREAGQ